MPSHPNRSRSHWTPGRNPTPEQVRDLRDSMGLSQRQFGDWLYASARTVQDWESGQRRMPGLTYEVACLMWEYPQVADARVAWLRARDPRTAIV